MDQFQCRVTVTSILEALQKNREKHIRNFKLAVEVYKREAEKLLGKMLKSIQSGKRISHTISLLAPVNYVGEYDRMIRMFEITLDKEVVLSETQYNMIFGDLWHWQGAFVSNTMRYLSGPSGVRGSTGVQGYCGAEGTMAVDGEGEDLIPADLK
jgi:hypothetical protein